MYIRTNFARSCHWVILIWFYISVSFWSYEAIGYLSFRVEVCLFSILMTGYLVGDLFVKYALKDNERFNSFSTRFLVGALITNLLFFITAFILPYNLTSSWISFVVVVFVVWFIISGKECNNKICKFHISECFFWVAATIAVTIWCQDTLRPIELRDEIAIIRSQGDIYYHLAQIGSLAIAKGLKSMSDVQMAGMSVVPYHLASYIFPALLVDGTQISTLNSYAGFLVPFGILLTGIAAYSLALSIFGKWPAVAAGLAVLLLPDAFQQGFGNKFLGDYYWLQQVAPGGNYGVACAAVAFMFLFEACRTTTYRNIFFGYLFVLVTLTFKAQIFVAISYLAFVFPVLFFGQIATKYRISLIVLFSGIFCAVVAVSQLSPHVPVIRPDGTGYSELFPRVLWHQNYPLVKGAFERAFDIVKNIWPLRTGVIVLYLCITTFGFFPFLYVYLIGKFNKIYRSVYISLFPAAVILNYLLMAISLALDDRHIGAREELLHRPFVWAYFVLVVWCSAGVSEIFFRGTFTKKKYVNYLLLILVIFFFVPIRFSSGIQTYEKAGKNFQQRELPLCQLKVAEYLHENSKHNDIIQDSLNDRSFILSGLSGRNAFAIDTGGYRTPTGVNNRLTLLKDLKNLSESPQVESFMKELAIQWYVVNPNDSVKWQETLISRVSFQCGGYRVYHFF